MSVVLDLRRLASFVAVAESGSFTRAAAQLGLAQSALSRQVRDLEDELGLELLHRNGRGAVPTESGREFAERARQLIAAAEALAGEMRARSGRADGTVTLGVPPSTSQILLSPLLHRIRDQHPGIQMRVVEGFSGHIYEWLLTGRIDLGVLYNTRPTQPLVSDALVREDMFLIAPPGDRITAAGTVPLGRLAGLPLVLPGRPHGLRLLVEEACARRKIALMTHIEVDALATMKNLVAEGIAYTILPFSAVVDEVAAGRLSGACICDPGISRELLLASATQRGTSRAARAVASVLRQLVADLVRNRSWGAAPQGDGAGGRRTAADADGFSPESCSPP